MIIRKVNLSTVLLSALVLTDSLLMQTAKAYLLLEVDLSVENTFAIKATKKPKHLLAVRYIVFQRVFISTQTCSLGDASLVTHI